MLIVNQEGSRGAQKLIWIIVTDSIKTKKKIECRQMIFVDKVVA